MDPSIFKSISYSDIPAEVRMIIWQYYCYVDDSLTFTELAAGKHEVSRSPLLTCRLMRDDVSLHLYKSHYFYFSDSMKALTWVAGLTEQQKLQVKHLIIEPGLLAHSPRILPGDPGALQADVETWRILGEWVIAIQQLPNLEYLGVDQPDFRDDLAEYGIPYSVLQQNAEQNARRAGDPETFHSYTFCVSMLKQLRILCYTSSNCRRLTSTTPDAARGNSSLLDREDICLTTKRWPRNVAHLNRYQRLSPQTTFSPFSCCRYWPSLWSGASIGPYSCLRISDFQYSHAMTLITLQREKYPSRLRRPRINVEIQYVVRPPIRQIGCDFNKAVYLGYDWDTCCSIPERSPDKVRFLSVDIIAIWKDFADKLRSLERFTLACGNLEFMDVVFSETRVLFLVSGDRNDNVRRVIRSWVSALLDAFKIRVETSGIKVTLFKHERETYHDCGPLETESPAPDIHGPEAPWSDVILRRDGKVFDVRTGLQTGLIEP